MKKSLLALAVLGAFTGVASAQSSVTLFGVVDLGLRSVNNTSSTGSDSNRYLASDGNMTSRLGFRGTEDLGGGLKAGFWIEGALAPDTGNTYAICDTTAPAATSVGKCTPSGGQTWQRRSTVSLVSQSLGELRLGRDYAPTFWNHTNYDPFGTNGVGSHNNMMMAAKTTGSQPTAAVNNSGLANFARNDNSIGYFLPAMGAISGQLQFAMPEDTGGKGQYFGGRLVYQQGGLSLAGQAATTQVGAKTAEHSSGVAGSYDFTSFKLMAQWNRYTLLDDNVVPNTTKSIPNNRLTNYLLGVTVPVNQQLTLKASYNSTSANLVSVVGTNIKNAKAVDGKQVALGLTYDLSKRTALYTTYSRINNGQDGTYVVSNSGLPIAASKSSSGYDLGIRHSF